MSLNRSVQKPHLKFATKLSATSPDYVGLVRFLLQSFLDFPESLSIDCEVYNNQKRAWIRIAFENADKGKVFGRGGRNIQAIRTVIAAAARMAGQSVYLDVYGSNEIYGNNTSDEPERTGHREITRRTPIHREKSSEINSSLELPGNSFFSQRETRSTSQQTSPNGAVRHREPQIRPRDLFEGEQEPSLRDPEEQSVDKDFQQDVPRPKLRERPGNSYRPVIKPRLQ